MVDEMPGKRENVCAQVSETMAKHRKLSLGVLMAMPWGQSAATLMSRIHGAKFASGVDVAFVSAGAATPGPGPVLPL